MQNAMKTIKCPRKMMFKPCIEYFTINVRRNSVNCLPQKTRRWLKGARLWWRHHRVAKSTVDYQKRAKYKCYNTTKMAHFVAYSWCKKNQQIIVYFFVKQKVKETFLSLLTSIVEHLKRIKVKAICKHTWQYILHLCFLNSLH